MLFPYEIEEIEPRKTKNFLKVTLKTPFLFSWEIKI